MSETPQPRTGATCVAVLGEALVDVYPDSTQVPGGAPFNVARWLAAFGVPALFITRLGQGDAAAAVLQAEVARFGLARQGVQFDPARPTGVVQVLPAQPPAQGHRFEIASDSAWDHIDPRAALPLLQAAAPGAVCFGSLALRHADSRAAVAQCVSATNALRFLDLNLREVPGLRALAELALQLADWVKANDEELHTLLAWFVCGGSPVPAPGTAEHQQALQALSQRFGIQRWVITCGAQGWFSAGSDGRTDAEAIAVPVARVQDTVGAGDAFTATVLAGHAHGWPLAQSLAAANRLAAAVCTWRGALPADDATVRHWRDALGFGPAVTATNPT